MKNIKILTLCTALAFTACDDGFLDREPLDAVTDVSYWKTEEQIELAANGCYAYIKAKNTVDLENLGDNTLWPSVTSYQQISSGNYNSELGTVNTEWASQYEGIRRCNHFLANYEQAVMDEELKARYAAEVRFIRAYLYSYLSFFFGDVQLITEPLEIDDPEIYGKRQPREEVVNWIMNELTESVADLPVSYDAAEYGRITKGAALGWKSRVALFYHRFAEAEQAAKEVMDLGVYALYSNGDTATSYYELFTYAAQASVNGNNQETILARVHTEGVSTHNLSREIQVPDQVVRWNPTKSLVDAYLCADGRPIGQSPLYQGEESYEGIFLNRDPRMVQTILQPGAAWEGLDDGDEDNLPNDQYTLPKFRADKKGAVTVTGYYFTKYCELAAVPTYNRDEKDIIILRYAEILLNYAEAMLEQGKLTQAVIDQTINQIRARVGMHPMRIDELNAWGMDLREEVRRERRVELALEGQRYFDILRWKQGDLLAADVKGMKKEFAPNAEDVAEIQADAEGYLILRNRRTFTAPKNYLWPIPLIQRERNPDLGNNPGW